MKHNFRLTVAREPKLQVPTPSPKHYDSGVYTLLVDCLRDHIAQKKSVKFQAFIDLCTRRNGKFELNNKQSTIFSLGHFGGQFEWPDANYKQRASIHAEHMD